jgi:hypothetical protein
MMIKVVLTGAKRFALDLMALVAALALSYSGIRDSLASYYSNQDPLEGFEKRAFSKPTDDLISIVSTLNSLMQHSP